MNNLKVGDKVYVSRLPGFTCGGEDSEMVIVATTIRYDEITGVPYKVIILDGNRQFNAESGYAITPPFAYYIPAIAGKK